MTKKLTLYILLVLFLSIVFSFFGEISVNAEEAGVKSIWIPPADMKAMEELWSQMGVDGDYLTLDFKMDSHGSESDTRLLVYDPQEGVLKFRADIFQAATSESRYKALQTFVSALQESRVSPQTQQNIMDTMTSMNHDVSEMLIPIVMETTTADVYTAMRWVAPILPILRVILGVGAIVITILLVGVTIIDLVYIGLPIARESMTDRSEKKGKRKPSFVSDDAFVVVREVEASLETTNSYKNAYLLYFKKRLLTYFILSICLLYLVAGELGGLIAWLLSLGKGVVQ